MSDHVCDDDCRSNGCKVLRFNTNDDGEMLDEDGDVLYCDACEAPATERVVVSEDSPHDDTRNYCESCLDVYYVGVQHGRYHEAARFGAKPGRDSSQDKPDASNMEVQT